MKFNMNSKFILVLFIIIGGLFYSYSDEDVVHMEKIVVSNRFRRKGVSEIIMHEFFNRMIDEGFKLTS